MSNSNPTGFESDNVEAPPQDRGLLDCFGKKHEKEDVPMAEAEHKPSLVEKLHRSNSSSSSSSEEEVEEDGKKIRRRKKKGLTDKIKEKLPGHKTKDASEEIHQDAEKKGILEKIKEKLPSHQKDESLISTAPAPTVVPTPPHYQPNEYSGGILGEDYKDEAFFVPAPASALTHDGGLVEEHNKDEAFFAPAPIPAVAHDVVPTPPHCQSGGGQCGKAHEANESEEKKGIIGKIMDMFPGGHKDGDEPKKDH